jgi:hypothetical protein
MQRIDQQRAQLFAQRRAARFSREDERDRRIGKVFMEQPDLRGFASPFDAFEGDEEPGRGY